MATKICHGQYLEAKIKDLVASSKAELDGFVAELVAARRIRRVRVGTL
jgi:hypothetical protein